MPKRSQSPKSIGVRVALRRLLAEKAAREQRPITIETAAREMGMPRATAYYLASNELQELPLEHAAKLASYLDCHPGDLLEAADAPATNTPQRVSREQTPTQKVRVAFWRLVGEKQERGKTAINPGIIARKKELNPRTVRAMAAGTLSRLPLDVATALIEFFEVEPNQLLEWAPDDPATPGA